MDYKAFAKRINEYVRRPEEWQVEKFYYHEGIHIILSWTVFGAPKEENYDKFIQAIEMLEERGAVVGENFIVVAGKPETESGVLFTAQLHVETGWISQEDFPEMINL